jgi:glycosyltransferase involved in cell wall biosynthesis
MRICLVYDCLYPWTVGGAERWYRALAEQLAAGGHEVTYLTLRQWDQEAPPLIPGVHVIAVGPRLALYTRGRRRILPPLIFGGGVLLHLLRSGRSYDVVHTASFPYFALLAAVVGRRWGRYGIVVDWWEVWTRGYWRAYLGRLRGEIGWGVQRLGLRSVHSAFCFSRLHERRLREEGFSGRLTRLTGIYAGRGPVRPPAPSEAVVVYAGRHIPEKRVPALIPAIAKVREHLPELRATIFGDGPDRAQVERLVARSGLEAWIAVPGFVDETTLHAALDRALCLVLPSRREGYGLVVVEAAARGTPSVVVRDPDNAATELIEEGVNGFIAPSVSAEDLASAILRVHAAGFTLRSSTASWFTANARRLGLASALETVTAVYADRDDGNDHAGRAVRWPRSWHDHRVTGAGASHPDA